MAAYCVAAAAWCTFVMVTVHGARFYGAHVLQIYITRRTLLYRGSDPGGGATRATGTDLAYLRLQHACSLRVAASECGV